jgi:hypothetical protein
MKRKIPIHNISRRNLIQGLSASYLVAPTKSYAQKIQLQLHHQRGSKILSDVLSNESYWEGASKAEYIDQYYDEIRLRSLEHGYLAWVSGEGKQDFIDQDVANTIFANQDIIPQFMPSLKSARYLGSGVDKFNGYAYNDIYFLADLKVMYISIALRTYKVQFGSNTLICPIEKVTSKMVDQETWNRYQKIYLTEQQKVQPLSFYQSIVEPDFVFGMYVMQPGIKNKTRVTLVTQLGFNSDDSFIAYVASELPFFLKQGMQVGFDASVQACMAYINTRK